MYIINICKNFKYLNKYIKVDVNISSNSPPPPTKPLGCHSVCSHSTLKTSDQNHHWVSTSASTLRFTLPPLGINPESDNNQ